MQISGSVHERQLTNGSLNKDLDCNVNFSADGRYLVFDCREEETGIGRNTRLGKVDVRSGEVTVFYEQKGKARGVGAASFIGNHEVIAIHALESGLKYDFTVRGGMIISSVGKGDPHFLDSRNVVAPFTPGALRGGTHKHEPDATGNWFGFTYNDHIMKFRNHSDLRNVGVCRRGSRVPVPSDPNGTNFTGASFSVLLTACVDHPRPGSDECQRTEGDCWVGTNGYLDSHGKRTRARAFRGTVIEDENGHQMPYSDVFLVNIPEDITKPGPLGPLEGTLTDYPKPPAGTILGRLTFTSRNKKQHLRGVSGHLRAPDDGKWIAFVSKAVVDERVENQISVVSPVSGEIRLVSHVPGGVAGDPRFAPNGNYVAIAGPDGCVYTVSTSEKSWGKVWRAAPSQKHLASNIVISPDSKLIAYNREISGIQQVFVAPAP